MNSQTRLTSAEKKMTTALLEANEFIQSVEGAQEYIESIATLANDIKSALDRLSGLAVEKLRFILDREVDPGQDKRLIQTVNDVRQKYEKLYGLDVMQRLGATILDLEEYQPSTETAECAT